MLLRSWVGDRRALAIRFLNSKKGVADNLKGISPQPDFPFRSKLTIAMAKNKISSPAPQKAPTPKAPTSAAPAVRPASSLSATSAPPIRPPASLTPRSSPQEIALHVWNKYLSDTPARTLLLDVYLAFLVLNGVVQFAYCVVAGNYVCSSTAIHKSIPVLISSM